MLDTSPEAAKRRSAARAKLSDPSRPPSFVIAPYGCEELCTKAKIGEQIVEREPGEKYEAFVDRVVRMFPAQGRPGFALMLTDSPSPASDAN